MTYKFIKKNVNAGPGPYSWTGMVTFPGPYSTSPNLEIRPTCRARRDLDDGGYQKNTYTMTMENSENAKKKKNKKNTENNSALAKRMFFFLQGWRPCKALASSWARFWMRSLLIALKSLWIHKDLGAIAQQPYDASKKYWTCSTTNTNPNCPMSSPNPLFLLHSLYGLIYVKAQGSGNSLEFYKNRRCPKIPTYRILRNGHVNSQGLWVQFKASALHQCYCSIHINNDKN